MAAELVADFLVRVAFVVTVVVLRARGRSGLLVRNSVMGQATAG